jgi:hypothetical protein
MAARTSESEYTNLSRNCRRYNLGKQLQTRRAAREGLLSIISEPLILLYLKRPLVLGQISNVPWISNAQCNSFDCFIGILATPNSMLEGQVAGTFQRTWGCGTVRL